MDVLYLTERDVEQLLTMEMALQAVEEAFRGAAEGRVLNLPRRRLAPGKGVLLHTMAAADTGSGYFGMKIYTSSPSGTRFLVPLYRVESGGLVALLEADYLGCTRTGAASGVATRHMARPEAASVGIVGCGHQAPTQLLAVAQVRRLREVRAYSPTEERRQRFAETMTRQLGVRVEPVDGAEAAVRDADIVVAITSAREPVVRGEWLAPGTHINAAGTNSARRRELDATVVERAGRIVVDSLEQSREEAGDLILPFAERPERWETVRELSEVVAGRFPGRGSAEEITLFKSNGVALEDVAVAARVYERAQREGVGRMLRMWDDSGN